MALAASSIRRLIPVGARFLSAKTTPGNSSAAKTDKSPQPAAPATKTAAPVSSAKPVGPGASKEGAYKNPEYYTYNPMSYYDIEQDMKPFRLPQPSSRK